MTFGRALLVCLLLAACKETKTVKIGFGAGERTPIGFRCRDDLGKFLVVRAIDATRTLRFAVVIDFIGLGGLPTCRPSDIVAFCETHSCVPLADPPRVCFDLEGQVSLTDNAVQLTGQLLRSLEGTPIADDAPHDPVIIRAVATAQSCAELATAPVDSNQLVGCALSCPVQLGGVEGDVILDLPTLSDQCAASVVACAQGML